MTAETLKAGEELPEQEFTIGRSDLVKYAGASGDFNPIHYSDTIATTMGLPGVVAHGMLTMALACRAVTVWLDDPAAIAEVGVRFSKPVVVPDDGTAGVTLRIGGTVKDVSDDGTVQLSLTVTNEGQKVLSQARATVVSRRG